jgi:DNA-binding NarL/FixJ family response regulator
LFVKILIVDDHSLVREGIVAMIRNFKPDAFIAQADTCAAAILQARHEIFDLMFLDLHLPDQPGMVALQRMRESYPAMPVVIISGQEDKATVMKTLDLGAKSFVPKSSDSNKVRLAIEAVLNGRIYLPESALGGVTTPLPSHGASQNMPWALTDRQVDVLALLVSGLPNKLIARRLGIVESTVKIHVSAILKELKVASRTQAIIAVSKAGVQMNMPA